jgi:hypothetical protein
MVFATRLLDEDVARGAPRFAKFPVSPARRDAAKAACEQALKFDQALGLSGVED